MIQSKYTIPLILVNEHQSDYYSSKISSEKDDEATELCKTQNKFI